MEGGKFVVRWYFIFYQQVYYVLGYGVIGSVRVDGTGYKEFKTGDGLTAFALNNGMLLWVTDSGNVNYF